MRISCRHIGIGHAIVIMLFCTLDALADNGIRIGYVDVGVLMQNVPQVKAAAARLRDEFSGRRDEMEECGERLQKMNDRLQKEGKRMSASARERLNRTVVKTRRNCKRLQDELQEDVNQRRNTEWATIEKQIYEVILEIAERERYDLIFSGPVVYKSKKVDLTKEVLEAMNKRSGDARP